MVRGEVLDYRLKENSSLVLRSLIELKDLGEQSFGSSVTNTLEKPIYSWFEKREVLLWRRAF